MVLLARCAGVWLSQGAAIGSNPCGLRPSHLVAALGLHALRLDIFAMSAIVLGPNVTALSRELLAGASGPSTPLHGSAHALVPPRKDVDKMRW